jgi:hypothetical protein
MSIKNNTTAMRELLNAINSLPEGVELPELNDEAVANELLTGKQLIDDEGNIVTGTMPIVTQATPSISIDSNGKITAATIQEAGYVEEGGKSSTKQLTTQTAKTITPSKSSQTAVAKNVYTIGAVTVAAIPNEYITTTDATAAAGEILSGETAYVNGTKVTGTMSNNGAINKTMDGINTKSITISKGYTTGGTVSLDNTIDNEVNTQENLMSQIKTVLSGKAAGGGTALPTLTNEGTADELLSGKQLINSTGKIVNGTFTIESELDTQEDLIAQIATAVDNLPEAGSGGGTSGGGVCPQLTIKGTANESIQVGICFYSTDNIYTCANPDGFGVTELILNNVDIKYVIVYTLYRK